MIGGVRQALSASAAVLQIRPGEGRRTALLFLHLLLASSVFILGRTVRDTLFLSRYSLSALPWMFVLYGVASSVTALVYSLFADKVPRHRMIASSVGLGIGTYLGVWVLVRSQASFIYPVFYVWSEVVANLFIVQFWTLANDLHDARAAKRLFGVIGAARVLGVVLIGLSTGAVVRLIGTPQLLFVLAGLMAAIAAVAVALAREPRPETSGAGAHGSRRPPPPVLKDRYVLALAVFILFTFAALTLGDYQFKAIARATYKEDALAQFFSFFYAATGLISFVFQVFVTPRLLGRFGVGWGMSVMPAVFGAASLVLPIWPHLAVATVMKFADNGFQYTIHETTLQALYVPFAAAVKARTRALLDAAIKPCAYGVGGLLLLVAAPRMEVQWLSLLTVALVAAWFFAIRAVRGKYFTTLQATLSARGTVALDSDFVLDAAGRAALLGLLERGRPREVLAAVERLGSERAPEITRALERLVASPDAEVRTAALGVLAAMPDARAETLAGALADPDPRVREAAARAYATAAGDQAVDGLAARLDDPDPEVRVAVGAGLLRQGGVDGQLLAGARLARLLVSAERHERREAAQILGRLGAEAYRPLHRLLEDPDPAVRRAALKACPGVPDPRLVPDLVRLVRDPACRKRAGAALVAIGRPAVGPLLEILTDESAPRAVRVEIPRLLRKVPSPDTYARLRRTVDTPVSFVRQRTYAALGRLREDLALAPESLEWVRERIRTEIAGAGLQRGAWHRALEAYGTPLVHEEVRVRIQRAVRRVLRILELRYPREPLELVWRRLDDPARRANALEVLDALLDPPLRPLVLPFVEGATAAEHAPSAAELAAAPAPEALVRAECGHSNPYVALLALEALAARRDPLGRELGAAALRHPDPLVREGGLVALCAADPDAAAQVRPLLEDPDPVVARHARAHLARLQGGAVPEDAVHSTVEKILFLKSAPVFEKVSGEDLAPLARVAVEDAFGRDERIFAEDEMGESLYVIIRGRVRISRRGETVAELGPGEAFGEMAALDAAPRSATATALEETETLRIGSEEFYETLHEQAEIAEGVIRMLTRRLREATGSAGSMMLPRAAGPEEPPAAAK